jgi:4-hydroxysphinganine ceramide fatty acyl 2-hydroxylase
MLLVFCRHGGVAALLAAVSAETLLWLVGVVALQPALILVGALLFYLSEYGMHRFAFHSPPLSWPPARKLQHRLHYDHHVEPSRLDLQFLPIWFLVPNLAVAAGLFALAFGIRAAASALLGMMLAILHYEWVHYVAHIPYQPRTRLGRWIKQYHLRHHFISEKHWFGVSWTACSGRFADPAPRKRAPPPAISIPEGRLPGTRESGVIKWDRFTAPGEMGRGPSGHEPEPSRDWRSCARSVM